MTIFRNLAYHYSKPGTFAHPPLRSSPLLSPKKSRVAEHKHIVVFRSRSRNPVLLQLFGVVTMKSAVVFDHYIIAAEEIKLKSTKSVKESMTFFANHP